MQPNLKNTGRSVFFNRNHPDICYGQTGELAYNVETETFTFTPDGFTYRAWNVSPLHVWTYQDGYVNGTESLA